MNHEQVTTLAVEAQVNCALQTPIAFSGMGTIEQQPYFKPIARRNLMAAVNTVSKDLGLRASSVMVVDALLSCLPCKDVNTGREMPISPLTLLTVYAANATLCFRAKGITERQLRRHLERLEEIGLIQRKDSANGKRFPIQRGGRVIGAFGIDLSPLLIRSDELCALAQKRRQEADEMRGLRSHIQKLRMDCLRLPLDEELASYLQTSQNIMRRPSTTLTDARAIISRLTNILMDVEPAAIEECSMVKSEAISIDLPKRQPPETERMPATDGQNVRHKELKKPYTKKTSRKTITEFWHGLTTLRQFFPNNPNCERGFVQIIFDFGKLLQIGQATLAKAISKLGYIKTLIAQDNIAAKADRISNPDAYLLAIITDNRPHKVGHGQLSQFA